jgi:hypothetical protein
MLVAAKKLILPQCANKKGERAFIREAFIKSIKKCYKIQKVYKLPPTLTYDIRLSNNPNNTALNLTSY